LPTKIIRIVADFGKISTEGVVNQDAYLGAADKKFVWVADYEEFRCVSMRVALNRLGVGGKSTHVAAVIFDANSSPDLRIRSGSVRGIFKSLRDIRAESPLWTDYFDSWKYPELKKDVLDNPGLEVAAYTHWRSLEPDYRKAFAAIPADRLIDVFGEIDPAEYDLRGFSRDLAGKGPAIQSEAGLIADFGAAIFIARNKPIVYLAKMVVIEFDVSSSDPLIPQISF
jgi:hypothetical protein